MPPSASDGRASSSAFPRLDPRLQRWAWEQGWTTLRDIQEAAIDALLPANPTAKTTPDVIIAAATAGGKTEAAFLPICSRLASAQTPGLGALYVAPLKALINDQHERLGDWCKRLDIPLWAWHGDIDAGRKKRFLSSPAGILLITPESLEAMFVLHGSRLPAVFGSLSFVVIDELHSFLGTERSRQLQSLLRRLEAIRKCPVPRIGLSATLGDMGLAAAALNPAAPDAVHLIQSTEGGQELRCQIRGYRDAVSPMEDNVSDAEQEEDNTAARDIAQHLFKTLRGTDNLIFANRRADVEKYADRLARLCAEARVPNEFWPHHGSLSRILREDVEQRLKQRDAPVSALCTSTLEMGIDIGSVASIAQIGSPPSVASMRQRLGRSGRRGDPAVLRVYIDEPGLPPDAHLLDALRLELVEASAMLRLLVVGWCEPPLHGALHLSTLVQQTLSVLAQYGGAGASFLWSLLCKTGPFRPVSQSMYAQFLRALAEHDLITQGADGVLMLGGAGERMVNHYSFYAAFSTADEYRLIVAEGGAALGTLPIYAPLIPDMYLIFAGRRWRVLDVDSARRVITLAAASAGRAPQFGGEGPRQHPRVREEMRALYQEQSIPAFLNPEGIRLLAEGREAFARYHLDTQTLVPWQGDTLLFHWSGDAIGATLMLLLRSVGVQAMESGPALTIATLSCDTVREKLQTLRDNGPADSSALAALAANPATEKHDVFLPEELLRANYASHALDPVGAWETLVGLLGNG